jgi:hypothetical protein
MKDEVGKFASTTVRFERGFIVDTDNERQNCQMYHDI